MKVFRPALSSALGFFLQASVHGAGSSKFYYDQQELWEDVTPPPGTNNECGRENPSGVGQSPIDIVRTECGDENRGYKFHSGDCLLKDYSFSINDHGMKAEITGMDCTKPTMIIPGVEKVYEVIQFHVHTGCENTLDGGGCDAELHIVHIAKTSTVAAAASDTNALPDLAVVGIMLFGGDNYNEAIDPLLDNWSAVSCSDDCDATMYDDHKDKSFTPYALLPVGTSFYKFVGGLTTPPCWEVVNWNVAENGMKVSWRQILALSNLVNNYKGYRNEQGQCQGDTTVASVAGLTGRETQPLLGRSIEKICTPYELSRDEPVAVDLMPEDAFAGDEARNSSTSSSGKAMVTVLSQLLCALTVLLSI